MEIDIKSWGYPQSSWNCYICSVLHIFLYHLTAGLFLYSCSNWIYRGLFLFIAIYKKIYMHSPNQSELKGNDIQGEKVAQISHQQSNHEWPTGNSKAAHTITHGACLEKGIAARGIFVTLNPSLVMTTYNRNWREECKVQSTALNWHYTSLLGRLYILWNAFDRHR